MPICGADTDSGMPCQRDLNAGRCPDHGTVGRGNLRAGSAPVTRDAAVSAVARTEAAAGHSEARERWRDLRTINDRALNDRRDYYARRWPSGATRVIPPDNLQCRSSSCREPITSSATEACVAHLCEHPGCGHLKATFQHCNEHEHEEDLRAWVSSQMTGRERCSEIISAWPYDRADMKLIANIMREQALEPLATGRQPRPANAFLEAAAADLEAAAGEYVAWPERVPRRNALMKNGRDARRVENPETGSSWCVLYSLYRKFWLAHYRRLMPAGDWRIPNQVTADGELCRYLESGSFRGALAAIAKDAQWLREVIADDREFLVDAWQDETGDLVFGAERQ